VSGMKRRTWDFRRLGRCGFIAAACLGAGAARAVDHPDLFRAWSPDFADNGFLGADNASSGSSPRGPWQCGGKNISPALSWSGAPADTKSFAIVMDDPDAAMGRGGNHWIVYDIPPTAQGISRGAVAGTGSYVPGESGVDKLAYHGPCAEPGAKPHHFLFMIYALDIPPGTLPVGLKKADFVARIQGHNLAEASVSARYRRAADGWAMQIAEDEPLKDQIIGTWTLVSWRQTRVDGSRFERFGPEPKGMQMFDTNGRYMVMIARPDLPKFGGKNPNLATADEARAVVGGAVTSFGSYTVDEAKRIVSLDVEVSTFPNQVGSVQKRLISSITSTAMTQRNPEATSGGQIELVWRRAP